MKTTLATIAVLLISIPAFGQNGQVDLTTRSLPELDAPIKLCDGSGPGASSTPFTFQLLLIHGTSLTPIFPTTTFRTTPAGPAQMYIVDPGFGIDIPGTVPGQTVTLRAQVFNGTAYNSPTTTLEGTKDFTVTLGGGTLPPALLTGLNPGFLIGAFIDCPEPSTIALWIFGLGALLICRWK